MTIPTLSHASIQQTIKDLESNSPSLTSISLPDGYTATELEKVAKALHTNTNLKTLAVSTIAFNEVVKSFAAALEANKTLHTLNLNGVGISPSEAEILAKALSASRTVTNLYLARLVESSHELGVEGTRTLVPVLDTNRLRELNLYNNQLGPQGAKLVAGVLKVNTSLTLLAIASNKIGVEGGTAIAEMLSVNRTLATLYIFNNQLGNSGNDIVKALESNSSLTFLDIRANNLLVDWTRLVHEMLKKNSSITYLNAEHNNKFSLAGLRSIQETIEQNKAKLEKERTADNNPLTKVQEESDADMGTGSEPPLPSDDNEGPDEAETIRSIYLLRQVTNSTFSLERRKLDRVMLLALQERLQVHPAVRDLNLRRCGLDDGGAAAVANILRNNRVITAINLSDNEIKEEGAMALGEALEGNNVVQRLNLANNPLAKNIGKVFYRLLSVNQTLVELTLTGTQISLKKIGFIQDRLELNQLKHEWSKISGAAHPPANHPPAVPAVPGTAAPAGLTPPRAPRPTSLRRMGLVNGGNMCWLSAVVQALRYTPALNQMIQKANTAAHPFLGHVARLLTALESTSKKAASEIANAHQDAYKELVQKQERGKQLDADEKCLGPILNALGVSYAMKKTWSLPGAGLLARGAAIHSVDETLNRLHLALPLQQTNVLFYKDLLIQGLSEEINGSALFRTHQHYFVDNRFDVPPPQVLPVVLKLFIPEGGAPVSQIQKLRKEMEAAGKSQQEINAALARLAPGYRRNHTPFRIDPVLTLSTTDLAGIFTERVMKTLGGRSLNYQLQACVIHEGERVSSGHYTAIVREQSKWLLYDDDQVTEISEDQALKSLASNSYMQLWLLMP